MAKKRGGCAPSAVCGRSWGGGRGVLWGGVVPAASLASVAHTDRWAPVSPGKGLQTLSASSPFSVRRRKERCAHALEREMGGDGKDFSLCSGKHLHLTQLWMGVTHVCLSSISSEFKQILEPINFTSLGVTEAEQISTLRSKHNIYIAHCLSAVEFLTK